MASAVFNYAVWAARWPALAAVTPEATAQAMFDDAAATLLDNSDASPVKDTTRRLALFNLLVAHLAALDARSAQAGAAGGGMLGRVASAGEGSVNVTMGDYPVGSGKWFEQTQYGAQYWQAIQPYLRFTYQPGPRPYTGVPYPRTFQRGW